MPSSIQTNSLQAWVNAFRLKTLGAILCPVLIGSSFAIRDGLFKFHVFMVVLVCSLCLQILANLVNDYGDFLKGADQDLRLGPKRAVASGFLAPEIMLYGIILVTLITGLLGAVLVLWGGVFVFLFGVMGLALCFWYTLGLKYSLSHLGFAEIAVAIFFGPVPTMGAYYVQALKISSDILVASLGPAFLSAALLLVNNLRDMNEDRVFGKMTTAVRLGERFSRYTIATLLIFASLAPALLNVKMIFVGFSVLPAISKLNIILNDPISAKFNLMLSRVGISLYLYGAIMSLGILISAY